MSDSEIESLCDRFDAAWNSEEPLEIESLLRQVDKQHQDRLLKALLEIEFEYRLKAGESVEADVYREQFPTDHSVIDEALEAAKMRLTLAVSQELSATNIVDNLESSESQSDIPSQIGPYKILQPIGHGGMGQVFMAEQTEPVRRRVALKIIKTETPTKEILARFEAERQALAMMDHQNIAKVLDAGVTQEGRPYFAMELVKGVPITDYCDSNRLTTNERLELFVQVCRAIQHAHIKGVIHRDIKPSNVLVTLYDGKPVAKVIDFGLAKALQETNKLTDRTLFTQYGQVVGTLAYMSPEQAEMNALDVDTRTDVYSLGVILYELLTGSTPIPRETIRKEAFDRVLALIREEETTRPSQRLSDSGDQITGISEQRRIDPRRLSLLLKGDLDWITVKALEKDRTRRYDTASALSEDVQRFLSHESVEARPPSLGYRLSKMIRRHRATSVAISCVAAAVTVGLALATWQWRRADNALFEVKQLNTNLQSTNEVLERQKDTIEEQNERLIRQKQTESEQRVRAESSESQARRSLEVSRFSLVQQKLLPDPRAALTLLKDPAVFPPDRQGFAWRLYHRWARRDTKTWQGHDGIVTFVCFYKNNQCVVTAGMDATCKIWNAVSSGVKETVEFGAPIIAGAQNPSRNEILLGDLNGQLHFLNPENPEDRSSEQLFETPIFAVSVSHDGQFVAAISAKELKILRREDCSTVREFSVAKSRFLCLGFDRRTGQLYVGGAATKPRHGTLHVFTGRKYQDVVQSPPFDGGVFTALAVLHDGSAIVALTSTGHLAHISTTNFAVRTSDRRTSQTGLSVAMTPKGDLIATSSARGYVDAPGVPPSLLVKTKHRLPAPFAGKCVTYYDSSHDPFREHVRLWAPSAIAARTYLPDEKECSQVTFSPDGQLLAMGDAEGAIKIVDIRDPAERTLLLASERVGQVSFSADGDALIANGKISWSTDNWKQIPLNTTDASDHVSQNASELADYVLTIPDSAIPSDVKGRPHASRDGQLLAFAHVGRLTGPTRIYIWDRVAKEVRHLDGHSGAIFSVAFSPDGQTFASGSYDQTVRLWDTETGAELAILKGHRSTVLSVAFSDCGNYLASGSWDETVRVWSAADEVTNEVPWPLFDEREPDQEDSEGNTNDNWSQEFHALDRIYKTLQTNVSFAEKIGRGQQPEKILADDFSSVAQMQQLKGQQRMYTEFEHRAIRFIERMLIKQSEDCDLRLKLAQKYMNLTTAHLQLNETSAAIRNGNRAVEILTELLSAEQLSTEGLANVQSLLGGSLNNLGMVFAENGDHKRAIEHYDKAVAAQKHALNAKPDNQHYTRFLLNHWTGLAKSFQALGQFKDAFDAIDQIEVCAEAIPEAGALMAIRKASIYCDPAFADNPDRDALLDEILSAVATAEQRGIPRPSLSSRPEFQAVTSSLSHAARELSSQWNPEGRAKAVELARKAADINPKDLSIQDTLGIALYRIGNTEESIKVLRACHAERKYKEPANLAFLVLAHRQRDQVEEAEEYLQQLREIMKQPMFKRNDELREYAAEAEAAMGDAGKGL